MTAPTSTPTRRRTAARAADAPLARVQWPALVRTPALVGMLTLVSATAAFPVAPAEFLTVEPRSIQDTAAGQAPQLPTLDDPEPVTGERALLDEAIRNQLQAVFDRVPDLADVQVTVDAGVVRLEGTVVRLETRERAIELASQMDGVLFLDARIRESTSLEQQLRPTWQRVREFGIGFVASLPLLGVAVLLVAAAVLLGSLIARWGGPSRLRARNPFLQNLLQRVLRGALILAAVLVALDFMNATALVGAVMGTAGLAGLAIGFAFKDIVENYIAGAILAFRQPFDTNDFIVVESFEGKVVRLTARETILMTPEGNHVRLPNALIFRNPMVNFTRNPRRRFQFDARIGTGTDLAGARSFALGVLRGMESVLDEPAPDVVVHDVGESSVVFRFMGWVDQRRYDLGRVRSEAIRLVTEGLTIEGYALASPEYRVRLHRGVTLADGIADDEAPGPAAEFSEAADVSVDHALDRQIDEERRTSDEPDLLEPADAPDHRDGRPAP